MRELGEAESARQRADLAASYQHAIVEALCARAERALEQTGLDRLAIGGGVAANGPLRERLAGIGVRVQIPDRLLCTDNAAMIASAARYVEPLAFPDYLRLDVYATGELPERGGRVNEVVLYGRAGCCLCDDARQLLLKIRDDHPFALRERDIESDDALLRAYLERIPVVTIDGVEAFELFVDEHELVRRLS